MTVNQVTIQDDGDGRTRIQLETIGFILMGDVNVPLGMTEMSKAVFLDTSRKYTVLVL